MKGQNYSWCARAISLGTLALLIQTGDTSALLEPTDTIAAEVAASVSAGNQADEEKEPRHEVHAGDVVIAGGIKGAQSTARAQFYDPSTKKFTKTGALNVGRAAPCGMTFFTDQSNKDLPFFIVGGAVAAAPAKGSIELTLTPLDNTEEYGRDTAKFAATTSTMGQSRTGCTATAFNDGTVLITGGLDASGNPQNTAQIFDPATGNFTPTAGAMLSPRAFHTATVLTSGPFAGDVLITGGLTNNSNPSNVQGQTSNTAELYHPATQTFTTVGNTMSDFRAFHTATALNDGTILITGGASTGATGVNFAATTAADIFDPSTQTFTPTAGPLAEPLLLHGATLLSDGTVLISGGFDVTQVVIFSNGATGSFTGTIAQGAEIYDPGTKTFSCLGGTVSLSGAGQTVCASVMKHPHAAHAAVLLNDGTVLIAGGFGGKADTSKAKTTSVAEIYDPSTKTFVKTGVMKPGVALAAVSLPLETESESK